MQEFQMLAKTFKGLEQVLAQELIELGASNVQIERRAVSFMGDKALMYRANMCLRTASRVLKPLAVFKVEDADEVYMAVKQIDWSQYMTLETGFTIDSTVYSEQFRHSKYVTYRVKDAIVDQFMEKTGKRPNVRLTNPDLYINVHISETQVTISLDSSGESLHKRGYRVANTEAPISEALAAGMLLMAGWKGASDFYDPMCGSGTFLIEAALIAQNIAPGVFRQEFAFEKWPDFDADLWNSIYNDDSRECAFTHRIYGSDASYYATQAALKNVKAAGQQNVIEVKQIRIQELKDIKAEGALVMMNPPYGERLRPHSSRSAINAGGRQEDAPKDVELMRLYGDIGTTLKHQFTGATAWVISSNEDALKCIGLKPNKKVHLLNGELECLFNCYELFAGERKEFVKSRPVKQTVEESGFVLDKRNGTPRSGVGSKRCRPSEHQDSSDRRFPAHERYRSQRRDDSHEKRHSGTRRDDRGFARSQR
ncbi:MAG: THUMP domain-containing protein [Paludibacteraceae bacterium]|nr:THUMP domain-containing protein [Paludibacteraceae bacterium]